MKLVISDYCLIVSSVEKSIAFYKDVIGLPMRFRNENFADFDLGHGARLALWEHAHVAPVVGGAEMVGPKGNRTMGAIRLGSRESVDELTNSLAKKGVHIIRHPQEWPWGAYAAYFSDPDANLWEIYYWATTPHTI
ncbi:MAG: VOC family protein [Anaerolineaceae bacterium]|jgi:Predicted lactoylglutathione lyase